MSQRTLAILSVSAGAGHVRAGEALNASAAMLYPGVRAVHINAMDLVSTAFRKLYTDTYIKIVEHSPALWSYLYDKMDDPAAAPRLQRLVKAIERLNTHRFVKELCRLAPTHVICTHYLPAQLLSRLIGKRAFTTPVWVQVTDFDVHALWMVDHMQGYFAASAEVAHRMCNRGIAPERAHVTGIPIMPEFSQPHAREACARELGLDPARRTLLLMSGGVGVAGQEAVVERLLSMPGDFQIVALAGRNQKMLANLRAIAARAGGRVLPLGFTTTIERVMAASDLAVTKPGGLTTSECLAMGLPMLLVSTIPGQEERNASYLLENGAALRAYDLAGMQYRVQRLMAEPERLAAMSAAARRLGRPYAARDVLARVLGEPGA